MSQTLVMPARDGGAGASRKAGAPAPAEPSGTRRKTAGAPAEFSAPSRVSEIQRQRILAAMAEVTAEQGAAQVTVAHIVARSGVSRRTFYELFSDRDDCLLATLELAGRRAGEAVLPAYRGEGRPRSGTPHRGGHPKGHPPSRGAGRQAGWREAMRAGLTALLGFFDEEPALARLCVVESLAAGPRALELRTRVVRALIDAVEGGRGEARPGARAAPPLTGEGVVGAVLAVVHARLVESRSKPLSPLTPALMSMIVAPYLGPAAAEKELQQPAPQLKTKPRPRRDPLDGLDMRLTYRTVRVLIAIADHPRASNRGVASAAGIADQGQISKLLMRLQNLGLIHNEGEGQPKGAANAWALTAKGAEVEGSIRMESASG